MKSTLPLYKKLDQILRFIADYKFTPKQKSTLTNQIGDSVAGLID